MKRLLLSLLTTALMTVPIQAKSLFAWGADIGTAVEMSGHDMSTINLDAYFGFKNTIINLCGAGAGIDMMVSNSCRTFPIYAILRTSFRSKPSLCFMDMRAGIAFNNLSGGTTQRSAYLNPSIGINLATGATYRSYIILGYVYNGLKSFNDISINGGLSYVNVRIGITF